jgi:hypothetical protein
MFEKPGKMEQFDSEAYQKEKDIRIEEAERLFEDEKRLAAYWNLEANLRGKILIQSAYIETQLAEIISTLTGQTINEVEEEGWMLGRKIAEFEKALEKNGYYDLLKRYSDEIEELRCINNLRNKMAHSSPYMISDMLEKAHLNSIQLLDHRHHRVFTMSETDVTLYLEKGNSAIHSLFQIHTHILHHRS